MSFKHDYLDYDPKQEVLMLLDWESVLAKDVIMT